MYECVYLSTSVCRDVPYSRTPQPAAVVSVCLLHHSVVGSIRQMTLCSPQGGSLETDPGIVTRQDTRKMEGRGEEGQRKAKDLRK